MAPARGSLSIPQSFATKKAKILESLAATDYTDASPKGSIDTGVVDLIHKINALEGLVTTSSCAGRVSVFLEGGSIDHNQDTREHSVNPGGKGGGQWLFVSHDPVPLSRESTGIFTSTFGLSQPTTPPTPPNPNARFIRFQYEPLILHILCASLAHAQPILAAGISSGFRESGVQSLKNLKDPESLPMVAIRSHGLALESVIGVLEDGKSRPRSLVSEEYLHMSVFIANERFAACEARKKRFEDALFGHCGKNAKTWEDAETRKRRKREEGLKRQSVKGVVGEGHRIQDGSAENNDLNISVIDGCSPIQEP